MARIAGVDVPNNKRTVIGLTYIFGIGRSTSENILKNVNVDPSKRIKDLTEDEIKKIRAEILDNNKIEGDLKQEIELNVKRLIDTQSYRGSRHRRGLPLRGQNTKNNAKTARKRKIIRK